MLTRILCIASFLSSTFGAVLTATADCYINSTNPANYREDHGTLSCLAGPVQGVEGRVTVSVKNELFVADTSSGVEAYYLRVDKDMRAMEATGARGTFFSSLSYQQTLTSEGAVRQGLIYYYLFPGPAGNAGNFAYDYQLWSVGPYSAQSTGRASQGTPGAGSFLVPFVLGAPFEVSMSSQAYSDRDSGSVGGRSSLEFRLFEADGVTPVRILGTDTPEPGMAIFTGLAVATIALRRRFRRAS